MGISPLSTMKTRIIAIMLILSHITISSVWASSHGAEDANGGCGDCIGYESPHLHIGGSHGHKQRYQDHSQDEFSDHEFESLEDEQQHFSEHHEHEDSHHVHLVFELTRALQWQVAFPSSSEQNALRDGHFFHRTVAPPVPPPTA